MRSMTMVETPLGRRVLAVVLGLAVVAFVLFMTPGKDCKNTCVNHTSYELAALSAVVAVSAAALLFVGRRRRDERA